MQTAHAPDGSPVEADAAHDEHGAISPADSEVSKPRRASRDMGGRMGWIFGAVLITVIAGTIALFAWMAGATYDPEPVNSPQALPGVENRGPG